MESSVDGLTPRLTIQEEKRLRRKAKNNAKKEDSRRAREEEIRRKLFEPKHQRVRIVNHNEMATLKGFKSHSMPRPTSNHFNLNVPFKIEEFPHLDMAKHGPRPAGLCDKSCTQVLTGVGLEDNPRPPSDKLDLDLFQISREKDYQEEVSLADHFQNDGISVDVIFNTDITSSVTSEKLGSEHTIGLCQTAVKNQNIKPKRADPIKINLLEILKNSKPARPSSTLGKNLPVSVRKKTEMILSGNQLDSSNPERKKGKLRENLKPQKPTHLKSIILQDRKTAALQQARKVQGEKFDCAVGLEESNVINHTRSKVELIAEAVEDSHVTFTDYQTGTHCSKHHENISLENQSFTSLDEICQNINALNICRDNMMNSIHNRKFREYCDHMLSSELDNVVSSLVKDIVKFQDRLYFNDPIKAHARRRFVLGFRETKKYLILKKIKLIIIAPDLERAQSQGGIDDTVKELKEYSKSQEVPCVFAIGRSGLRKLTNKSCAVKGISCIGIINYEGSQDNFYTIQSILPELRSQYQRLMNSFDDDQSSTAYTSSIVQVENIPTAKEDVVDVNKRVVTSFLVNLAKQLECK